MFDKQLLKIKLEFFLRMWHSSIGQLSKTNCAEEIQLLFTLFWHSALLQMWQTRTPGMILYGIDDLETYNAFCELLTLGMNQLNTKIADMYQQGFPVPIFISKCNVLIISRIEELADEVEELFKTNTQPS